MTERLLIPVCMSGLYPVAVSRVVSVWRDSPGAVCVSVTLGLWDPLLITRLDAVIVPP